VKNSSGEFTPVIRKAGILLDQQSLASYMYLTDCDLAGGGPYVFQDPVNRREVTWGQDDVIGGGNVQSNCPMIASDYGCPTFESTVWVTYGTEFDLGGCDSNVVFLGDPKVEYRPEVVLPPSGYTTLKNAADVVYDATEKMKWAPSVHRDTLIMTEITFIDEGYHVKQWWFLQPPHLKSYGGSPAVFGFPAALEWNSTDYPDFSDNNFANYCRNPLDLRTCDPYRDSLFYFHGIHVSMDGNIYAGENLLDPQITGQHGLAHFDYEPINTGTGLVDEDALTLDETVYYTHPSVIYIKGGPVRVSGTFTGRYTIVTDDFIPYRRHAWPTPRATFGDPPLDILWCSIWIVDDIINSDALDGDMATHQPDEECVGGSDNILGLVSGANVIIANTRENGAWNSHWAQDVIIHAGIIAFNESFVVQYWQNTVSTNTGQFSSPPWGDGRGIPKYGPSGNVDERGTVELWGSIVQKFRGYMQRNQPGPYPTNDIGMDKDWQYDENLACNPPPFYPTIEFDNNERSVTLASYGPIE
ncbi:MAG: hypothetical protein H8D46_04950, partial [FCB group bacterium]|nr:hypothetical protein [FCB group bacterium]